MAAFIDAAADGCRWSWAWCQEYGEDSYRLHQLLTRQGVVPAIFRKRVTRFVSRTSKAPRYGNGEITSPCSTMKSIYIGLAPPGHLVQESKDKNLLGKIKMVIPGAGCWPVVLPARGKFDPQRYVCLGSKRWAAA